MNRCLPLRERMFQVVLLLAITVLLPLAQVEDALADAVVDWVERDNGAPLQTGYHPGAGDLNGDGWPDFLAFRAYGATCYRNDGPDTTAVEETSWGRVKAEFRQ